MEVTHSTEHDHVKEREKGESNRSKKKSCSAETPMAEQNTSVTSNR